SHDANKTFQRTKLPCHTFCKGRKSCATTTSPLNSGVRLPAALSLTLRKGIRMANKIELPAGWVCDGRELKPKSGASLSNTWIFDGKEIKPKSGASLSNTWIWDGKELKPKSGASLSN